MLGARGRGHIPDPAGPDTGGQIPRPNYWEIPRPRYRVLDDPAIKTAPYVILKNTGGSKTYVIISYGTTTRTVHQLVRYNIGRQVNKC